MKELFFDNINGIGNMYLEYELFSVDYPVFFVLSDEQHDLYFSICVEIRQEQRWVLSKTNINELILLIENHKTLRDLVKSPYNQNFIITYNYETMEYKNISLKYEEIDEDDLPDEGIVLYKAMERHLDYYKELIKIKTYLEFFEIAKTTTFKSKNSYEFAWSFNYNESYDDIKVLCSEYMKDRNDLSGTLGRLLLDVYSIGTNVSKSISSTYGVFKSISNLYYNNIAIKTNIEISKDLETDNNYLYTNDDDISIDFKTFNVSSLKQNDQNLCLH